MNLRPINLNLVNKLKKIFHQKMKNANDFPPKITDIVVYQINVTSRSEFPSGEFYEDLVTNLSFDLVVAQNESEDDVISRIASYLDDLALRALVIHLRNNFTNGPELLNKAYQQAITDKNKNPTPEEVQRELKKIITSKAIIPIMDTSKTNSITRLSLNEFALYPNRKRGPLTINGFTKLLETINENTQHYPDNIHLLFASVPVVLENNNLRNMTIFIQSGKNVCINTFAKAIPYEEDPEYFQTKNCLLFTNQLNSDNKRSLAQCALGFSNSAQKHINVFFGGNVLCETAGGSLFVTAIEICLDHTYSLSKHRANADLKLNQAGNKIFPVHASHVILSNRVDVEPKELISETFTQADPEHSKKAGIRVGSSFIRKPPNEVQDILNPIFGSHAVLNIYHERQLSQHLGELNHDIKNQNVFFVQLNALRHYRHQRPLETLAVYAEIQKYMFSFLHKALDKKHEDSTLNSETSDLIDKYLPDLYSVKLTSTEDLLRNKYILDELLDQAIPLGDTSVINLLQMVDSILHEEQLETFTYLSENNLYSEPINQLSSIVCCAIKSKQYDVVKLFINKSPQLITPICTQYLKSLIADNDYKNIDAIIQLCFPILKETVLNLTLAEHKNLIEKITDFPSYQVIATALPFDEFKQHVFQSHQIAFFIRMMSPIIYSKFSTTQKGKIATRILSYLATIDLLKLDERETIDSIVTNTIIPLSNVDINLVFSYKIHWLSELLKHQKRANEYVVTHYIATLIDLLNSNDTKLSINTHKQLLLVLLTAICAGYCMTDQLDLTLSYLTYSIFQKQSECTPNTAEALVSYLGSLLPVIGEETLTKIIMLCPDIVRFQNREGDTLLHLAIYTSSLKFLPLLHENNADFYVPNNQNLTVFDYSTLINDESIFEALYPYSENKAEYGFQFFMQSYRADDDIKMLAASNVFAAESDEIIISILNELDNAEVRYLLEKNLNPIFYNRLANTLTPYQVSLFIFNTKNISPFFYYLDQKKLTDLNIEANIENTLLTKILLELKYETTLELEKKLDSLFIDNKRIDLSPILSHKIILVSGIDFFNSDNHADIISFSQTICTLLDILQDKKFHFHDMDRLLIIIDELIKFDIDVYVDLASKVDMVIHKLIDACDFNQAWVRNKILSLFEIIMSPSPVDNVALKLLEMYQHISILKDEDDNSLLHLAAMKKSVSICKILMENHLNPEAKNNHNISACDIIILNKDCITFSATYPFVHDNIMFAVNFFNAIASSKTDLLLPTRACKNESQEIISNLSISVCYNLLKSTLDNTFKFYLLKFTSESLYTIEELDIFYSAITEEIFLEFSLPVRESIAKKTLPYLRKHPHIDNKFYGYIAIHTTLDMNLLIINKIYDLHSGINASYYLLSNHVVRNAIGQNINLILDYMKSAKNINLPDGSVNLLVECFRKIHFTYHQREMKLILDRLSLSTKHHNSLSEITKAHLKNVNAELHLFDIECEILNKSNWETTKRASNKPTKTASEILALIQSARSQNITWLYAAQKINYILMEGQKPRRSRSKNSQDFYKVLYDQLNLNLILLHKNSRVSKGNVYVKDLPEHLKKILFFSPQKKIQPYSQHDFIKLILAKYEEKILTQQQYDFIGSLFFDMEANKNQEIDLFYQQLTDLKDNNIKLTQWICMLMTLSAEKEKALLRPWEH